MANKKPKQNKPKTGLARCLELASNKKGLVFLSAILSSLAAIASFVPYIAVYFIISSILKVYPNLELLDMSKVMNYGWIALAGIIANILLYFLAIFSSHMAAFGTLYELKLHFAEHITKIPLSMKKIAVKVEMICGVFMSSASMILQAGIGIVIFVGTMLLVKGEIELLPLLMFFLMVTRIYGPILAILSQLTTLLNLNVR